MCLSAFSECPYERLDSPVLMLPIESDLDWGFLFGFFSQELIHTWNSSQGLGCSERWLGGTRPVLSGKTRLPTHVAAPMHSKPETSWKPWALQVLPACFAYSQLT